MARRKIYSAKGVTLSGVPFTSRVQYDPDYCEYRATVFTADCDARDIEERACYDNDKESIMGTLHAMTTEFGLNYGQPRASKSAP